MHRALYKKSWFWMAVILSVPLAAWLYDGYRANKEYEAFIAPYVQKAQENEAYYQYEQAMLAKEKQVLQDDTYGGATPEETLALFVEALEARDAALASKYYMPWLQDDAEKDMKDWIGDAEALQKFLSAYHNGVVKQGDRAVNAAMKIYDNTEDQYPYIIEMKLNKENNIWKITEF